jgi:hypothetical protein
MSSPNQPKTGPGSHRSGGKISRITKIGELTMAEALRRMASLWRSGSAKEVCVEANVDVDTVSGCAAHRHKDKEHLRVKVILEADNGSIPVCDCEPGLTCECARRGICRCTDALLLCTLCAACCSTCYPPDCAECAYGSGGRKHKRKGDQRTFWVMALILLAIIGLLAWFAFKQAHRTAVSASAVPTPTYSRSLDNASPSAPSGNVPLKPAATINSVNQAYAGLTCDGAPHLVSGIPEFAKEQTFDSVAHSATSWSVFCSADRSQVTVSATDCNGYVLNIQKYGANGHYLGQWRYEWSAQAVRSDDYQVVDVHDISKNVVETVVYYICTAGASKRIAEARIHYWQEVRPDVDVQFNHDNGSAIAKGDDSVTGLYDASAVDELKRLLPELSSMPPGLDQPW